MLSVFCMLQVCPPPRCMLSSEHWQTCFSHPSPQLLPTSYLNGLSTKFWSVSVVTPAEQSNAHSRPTYLSLCMHHLAMCTTSKLQWLSKHSSLWCSHILDTPFFAAVTPLDTPSFGAVRLLDTPHFDAGTMRMPTQIPAAQPAGAPAWEPMSWPWWMARRSSSCKVTHPTHPATLNITLQNPAEPQMQVSSLQVVVLHQAYATAHTAALGVLDVYF